MLRNNWLLEKLGKLPEDCPLSEEIDTVEEFDSFHQKKVKYQGIEGDSIPAYLAIPKLRKEPLAAMLCIHQHANQYHLGKSEVMGLEGNREQAYGKELVEMGYVVLAPDLPCFEERIETKLGDSDCERFLATRLLLEGSTLQSQIVWELSRAVDFLCSLEEVDSERIGCIGHSYGGQEAMFLAALDERINAAVSSCGFSSYEAILREQKIHNYALYLPGVYPQHGIGDILSLISPRPFLAMIGEFDGSSPVDGAMKSVESAYASYSKTNLPVRLKAKVWKIAHAFPDEQRKYAYDWLEEFLQP